MADYDIFWKEMGMELEYLVGCQQKFCQKSSKRGAKIQKLGGPKNYGAEGAGEGSQQKKSDFQKQYFSPLI